ncbi:serine protease AprX [Priestia megaterium]|uniref:S8 family peptidase n=1 Tax=Priestia megaterium TaxID=1404 RepID=UPI003399A8D6
MEWIQAYKHKMDLFLFQTLSSMLQCSHLNFPPTLAVLIKQQSSTDLKNLEDFCELNPLDKKGNDAPLLNFLCAKLSIQTIQLLLTHQEVEKIYLDREIHSFLDVASKSIGGAYARNIHGLSGKGVTIAILDTGVYPHLDFTAPTNRILDFVDFIEGKSTPYDDNGHGTHVAGCVAGNGLASKGKFTGMAPESQLIGVKVLDKKGNGYLSSVIAGINYCIENKQRFNIRIINLSLGTDSLVSYNDDPLAQAAEKAFAEGIIVIVAAGESGPGCIITSPATHPKVITVGAVADRKMELIGEELAYVYTSYSQAIEGLIKPDVFFPGLCITAPIPPHSILHDQLEPFIVDKNYMSLSGSSIATGLCSGTVALLLEAYPFYPPEKIKFLISQFQKDITSKPHHFKINELL